MLRRACENADAERFGAGLQHGEGLRVNIVSHKKSLTALDVVTKRHGFGGGGGFVEKRRIRDLHSGEIADHCLKIQQRLEATLSDFGLVGRVGGIPTRILQNVAADDRRGVRAVNPHANVGGGDFVFGHDGAELLQGGFLREGLGQIKIAGQTDRGGNGFLEERVERAGADGLAHGLDFFGVRADVAMGKCSHFRRIKS